MNLPQPEDCSGSTGSDCKITPRFTCPAYPPSNTTYHMEEPACTARAGQAQSPWILHRTNILIHKVSWFRTHHDTQTTILNATLPDRTLGGGCPQSTQASTRIF
ncbi:hypothetical protein ATANTOWER_019968 [Ataeniobius toweri]|uniref:Uncharacterized protein n=1 Tax=Ataeniobius toweri TaxID=208326 RepID=A0ABU7BA86_9TELE|nr:hypothetical protein [Ataeniobius toweri]